MCEPAAVDVSEWIGTSELGSFQKKAIALVGCSLVMDGFDTQSIGFVAPTLVSVWHLQASETGPLFAAGLFGMLTGAIALGWLSDQIGRRRVLLGATLLFGLCSAATVLTVNISQMAVLRFFTGFGIGGVLPLLIAMLMWRGLPESPQFLVLRQERLDEVRKLLKRISPQRTVSAD